MSSIFLPSDSTQAALRHCVGSVIFVLFILSHLSGSIFPKLPVSFSFMKQQPPGLIAFESESLQLCTTVSFYSIDQQ